jgi:hypothetical protein
VVIASSLVAQPHLAHRPFGQYGTPPAHSRGFNKPALN